MTNICIYKGISCEHANVFGDCRIGHWNCRHEKTIELKDGDLEEYLEYDLFDDED